MSDDRLTDEQLDELIRATSYSAVEEGQNFHAALPELKEARAVVEQLAVALEEARPLAICWADYRCCNSGSSELHPTHAAILMNINVALAAAAKWR